MSWPYTKMLVRVAQAVCQDPTEPTVRDAAFELGGYVGSGQITQEQAVQCLSFAPETKAFAEAIEYELEQGAKWPRFIQGLVTPPTAEALATRAAINARIEADPTSAYLEDLTTYADVPLLGVRAGLASGKTHQIVRLVAQAKKVTVVSPLRRLITDVVGRFAAGVEEDGAMVAKTHVDDYRDGKYSTVRLAVCLPSLVRRRPHEGLVVIDEVESVRRMLTQSKILSPEAQRDAYAHLAEMMREVRRQGGQVVFCDAHLTEGTMQWASDMMGVPYKIVEHEGRQIFNKVVNHGRVEDVEHHATESLRAGRRVAVACLWPSKGRALAARWRRMGFNVLVLDSDSTDEDIKRPASEWADFDATIFGPIIATGVNITEESKIDDVCLIAQHTPGLGWDTVMQLCHRVRVPRSSTLHAYVDPRRVSTPTSEEAVAAHVHGQQDVMSVLAQARQWSGTASEDAPESKAWLASYITTVAAQRECCQDVYRAFVGEFTRLGIPVTTPSPLLSDDAAGDLRKQSRKIMKEIKDAKVQAILTAEDITSERAASLGEGDTTVAEREQIERRREVDFFGEVNEDIIRGEMMHPRTSTKVRRLVAIAKACTGETQLPAHTDLPQIAARFLRPYLALLVLRSAGVDVLPVLKTLDPGVALDGDVSAVLDGLKGTSNMSCIYSGSETTPLLDVRWTNKTLLSSELLELLAAIRHLLPTDMCPRRDVAVKPAAYIGRVLTSLGVPVAVKRTGTQTRQREYSIDMDAWAKVLPLYLPHARRELPQLTPSMRALAASLGIVVLQPVKESAPRPRPRRRPPAVKPALSPEEELHFKARREDMARREERHQAELVRVAATEPPPVRLPPITGTPPPRGVPPVWAVS